ncbi:MAG: CoA transferase [Acidimicrobiales bacterium]|nr:CoA transferase [Acidimicrobiales bacterium]
MSAMPSHAFRDGPLTGIKVIDLSAVISGPFGTAMLADQGADVILVERADAPDIVRDSGPLLAGSGISAMFASMNRNKRTIALDLKQDAGRELLKELVRGADVVVQNFRPGALDRLGVGWSVLSEINPDLIMCSVSGFGADGPYSHRPAFDPIVQSIAAYPTVQTDDQGRPNLIATAVCDKATSMQVAQSILAALVARANGAGGQHIEVAMVDVAVHFLWPEAMWSDTYLEHTTDMPNLNEIYKLYRTSDGWAMVYSVATAAHWRNMCTALGRLDLAEDPRFADLQGRVRYGAEVNDEIQAETTKYTTADLVELMDRADVPVAPVNTRAAMIDDPHIRHRGLLVETDHPAVGRIRQVRPPARYSRTPSTLRRHAPCFGEHTDEILADVLGRTPDQVRSLRESGVVR